MAQNVSSMAPERPIVAITASTKQKLDAYIMAAEKTEVTGLGIVSMPKPNIFLIEDVFILKQKASYSDAVMDQEAMHQLMMKWLQEGRDISTIKLQWHSHVNFPVFWSFETDVPNIERFDNGVNPWMISVVGNQHGEYLARVDIFMPMRVTVDGLSLTVLNTVDPDIMKAAIKEVADKVEVMAQPIVYVPAKKRKGARYASPK